MLNLKAQGFHHLIQHMVLQIAQAISRYLQGHMPVAQMVTGFLQQYAVRAGDTGHCFVGGFESYD
jgi:hypothetical protein